jgi:hypothetical protein
MNAADQQASQTLAQAWPQILRLVRQENPPTYGLLNSCKSHFVHGDRLILNFASDVLKERMAKSENLDLAQRIVSSVMQRQMSIQCNVDTAQRDSIPPGADDDGMVARAARPGRRTGRYELIFIRFWRNLWQRLSAPRWAATR